MYDEFISDEIAKLENYMESLRLEVEGLQILPRGLLEYPIDSIALGMVSKSFALARACITLLKTDFPEEAYGLSRSVVECALILRYITSDPDFQSQRAAKFVGFSKDFKNYWLHFARQAYAGKPEEDEIERYAKRYKLTGDPSKAQKHWSELRGFTWNAQNLNHPLDGTTFDKDFKVKSYAVDYFQTSQYVHCSQPALDDYVPSEGKPFIVSCSSDLEINAGQRVLYILLSNLHAIVGYALYSLGIDRP